jgi:hypothetical protein
MGEPVGCLRAVVVGAQDLPRLAELWQVVLGVGVGKIEARPDESHHRMADPEGDEFTVVLPPTPELVRETSGAKGAPA